MKRFASLTLAALLVLSMAACGKKDQPGTIKDGKALSDVIAAVDEKFAEKHGEGYGAVAMASPVDSQYLSDFLEIESSFVDEVAGSVSISMTNSDAFFGIKAKEGKEDAIRAALEKRRDDLIAQYERYPVSGSYERAQSAQIYQKGSYLFLIVVGVMPQDPDEPLDFASDIELVKSTIDGMFND